MKFRMVIKDFFFASELNKQSTNMLTNKVTREGSRPSPRWKKYIQSPGIGVIEPCKLTAAVQVKAFWNFGQHSTAN